MQKAAAKKQQPHKLNKPSKPKTKPNKQSWRKKVGWSAAGRKAYETRMKNLKKNKKAAKPQECPRKRRSPATEDQKIEELL